MKERNASRLRFKEFNYDDAKQQLPEGYEPIPYLPVMANVKRHAQICIHGLSSEEAAIQFIAKYESLFPTSSFIIQKALQNAIQYEYQVIAPYELTYFMDETKTVYPTVVVKSTPYNGTAMPQVLYRTIGSANVKKLFERGELLLSTFKRCRALENDALN